jgi:hypothetical protein
VEEEALKKSIQLALVILLAGSLLMLAVQPAYADVRLEIRVTDCDTGVAIGNATINVTTAKKGSKTKAVTNAKGYAELFPVRPENTTHTITVTANGYKDRTIFKEIGKDVTVKLDICLNSNRPTPTPKPTLPPTLPPAPTIPPVPTPIQTNIPTANYNQPTTEPVTQGPLECKGYGACASGSLPTGDQLDPSVADQCLTLISKTIIDVLPVEQADSLNSSLSTAQEDLAQCMGDATCVVHDALMTAFEQVIASVPAEVARNLPQDFIAIPIYNLVTSPEGQELCTQVGPVLWDMTRILSQQLQPVDAIAQRGPASFLVSAADGSQSGFRPDGSVVQDIPASIVGMIEGSNFVLLPPGNLDSVQIQASQQGSLNLDLLENSEGKVEEVSFQNAPVSAQSTGEVDFSAQTPQIVIDATSIPATKFEQYSVAPGLLETQPETPVAQASGAPESQATPTSRPSLVTPDNIPTILIAALVCIVSLAVGVLALILLLTRFRRSDEEETEEAPPEAK